MIGTDTIHPPGCATTLIVSLGLLSTPTRVGIIVARVARLLGFHGAVLRLFDRRWATTPQDYLGPD